MNIETELEVMNLTYRIIPAAREVLRRQAAELGPMADLSEKYMRALSEIANADEHLRKAQDRLRRAGSILDGATNDDDDNNLPA